MVDLDQNLVFGWLVCDVTAVVAALDLVALGFQGYWLLGARTQSTALDTLSRPKLNFKSTNTNTNTNWERKQNLLHQMHCSVSN